MFPLLDILGKLLIKNVFDAMLRITRKEMIKRGNQWFIVNYLYAKFKMSYMMIMDEIMPCLGLKYSFIF